MSLSVGADNLMILHQCGTPAEKKIETKEMPLGIGANKESDFPKLLFDKFNFFYFMKEVCMCVYRH